MSATTSTAPAVRRVGGYFAKDTMHCGENVAKSSMSATYPPELMEPPSEFLLSLFASGNAHEATVFSAISDAYPQGHVAQLVEAVDASGERTKEGKDALERDTFAALCDPEVKVILNARFGVVFEQLLSEQRGDGLGKYDESRISQPDIVLVIERDERGIATVLLPVDVKDHKVMTGTGKAKEWGASQLGELDNVQPEMLSGCVKVDDFMQLAHYHRHFERLGLASPDAVGAIVGREMKAVWAGLDEEILPSGDGSRSKRSALSLYDEWEATGRDVVANATARDGGAAVPALTFPELKAQCGECAWRKVCDDELVAHPGGGHITLLPGLTPNRAQAHYDAGVSGIRQLARLDLVTAAAVEAGTVDQLSAPDPATARYGAGKDLVKAIMQARVSVAGRVARVPGVDAVDLKRADVEIDFDLENSNAPVTANTDGSHMGGPLVYVWGTRQLTRRVKRDGTTVTSVKVRLFSDFTDTSEGEATQFAAFWSFLTGSREQAVVAGKTWRAYHYTSHEVTWMRKLAERHHGVYPGVPSVKEVDDFLEIGDVVDLYKILSTQLIWPTRSHSIKHLAKWARFSWRASDAGGDNSMLWYELAVAAPTAKARSEYRKKVLDYNTDDVAAQAHLRDWITSLEAADSPRDRIPSAEKLRRPLA